MFGQSGNNYDACKNTLPVLPSEENIYRDKLCCLPGNDRSFHGHGNDRCQPGTTGCCPGNDWVTGQEPIALLTKRRQHY